MTTLDELRRANLQEQHRSAGTTPPQSPPPASAQETVADAKEAPGLKAAAPESVEPTLFPEPPAAIERVASSQKAAPQNGHAQPAAEAKSEKESDLVERVHQALVRKVIYPTGVKATVDMPPELFWRLKRYCRDHNNATLRQVFLDVMMAYLDEEGY